ncbi:MAG: EAL domain-containing protein [Meiothermus sp.]|nr:EAL domain-containing protein [Meiothermus sp.]
MSGIQLPVWSLAELVAVSFCWAVWMIGLSLRPTDPQTQQLVRSYRLVTLAVNLILTSLFLAHSSWVDASAALWWSYFFATTLPPVAMRVSRRLAGEPVLWPEVLYWAVSAGCAAGLLLAPEVFVTGERQNSHGFPQPISGWAGLLLTLNQVAGVTWSLAGRFRRNVYGPISNFRPLFAAWMVYIAGALLEQLSTANWVTLPPTFWLGALALNLEFTRMIYRHQGRLMAELAQANRNLQQLAENLEGRVNERTHALQKMAHFDALTGLLNRSHAEQQLGSALKTGHPLAVLMVDLDRFKQINDTAGHPVGDAALREVARRFREVVPAWAVLARMGGDEFMVMLPQGSNLLEEAQTLSNRLVASLGQPVVVDDGKFFLGASVGIALFPQHGHDSATLLRLADIAMYHAKGGGSGYRVFDARLDAQTTRRIAIEHALRQALERDPGQSFHLEYQPVVEISSGRIATTEALLRWNRPPDHLGPLEPDQFIAVAEDSGLIVKIDDWVLWEACRQLVEWHRQGHAQAYISLNISVQQFERPDFVLLVKQALQATGCPPGRLALEILETALIEHFEEARLKIAQLRALGVRLSLDDFGTGYSSLAYLHRLTFDTLKIDRFFVQNLGRPQGSDPLVSATLLMARSFRMYGVAEGVETVAQAAELEALGCPYAQGWLYSKAVPPEQMGQLWGRGHLSPHNQQVPLLPFDGGSGPRG